VPDITYNNIENWFKIKKLIPKDKLIQDKCMQSAQNNIDKKTLIKGLNIVVFSRCDWSIF
jgi:hypothetical protein